MSNGSASLTVKPMAQRRLRFDRAAGGLCHGGLNRSLLLGLNRDVEPVQYLERRAEARYDVPTCCSWLGWRTWRGFKMRDSLIINISLGGALIFLDEVPPTRGKLWLYLETPRQKTVIPAKVCEIRQTRLGQAAVRLAFFRRCPYDIFEAAVCGLTPVDPRTRRGTEPRSSDGEGPRERSES